LDPNTDVNASAEYKVHIAPKIIKNVLIKSVQNYKEEYL
jgi:CO/xanthine dehydrogenase FAD-binding subunit